MNIREKVSKNLKDAMIKKDTNLDQHSTIDTGSYKRKRHNI